MTSKFSRFLHLERSRGERPNPNEPARLQSGSRFETLAQRGAGPQEAAVPDAHLERFRGEAPLALEEVPAEAERFPRCARCESDNSRFARECALCGADLNTPEQRAYNETFWKTRQQALAQEREAVKALGQQQRDEDRRDEQARFDQMLEKLREEERASSRWDFFTGETPFGWRLLSLISDPVVRVGVLIVSILIPVALWRYGVGRTRLVGVALGFLILMSLLPSNRRRWWR
ncbi:hypothetical protein [Hyalangium versicolor]|uniref:hypothetical protein n=1 Tax=Hyalangium versicolor TaxID=2861190 RepID=UPI001CD01353|nr:hypothetical protein [Hyalangium versicolor]